jgi:hypothetical protein
VTALNVVLPAGSSIVSFVFAALVFDQWRQRRRAFQLVWSIGLLWYGISAGTEALGSALGWNPALYRVWYLVGALFVAAYLGAGTVYLLAKTRFGYAAAVTVFLGGLLTLAFSKAYPGSTATAVVGFALATVAAIGVGVATAVRRDLSGHVFMGFLVVASIAVAVMVLTAPLAAPGYATDSQTHVPVGSAVPGYVRVLTGPFNIGGALCLVLGAIFSAYIYMPKVKVVRGWPLPLAVPVNLVASLPGAIAATFAGRVNSRVPATILIAIGGFIPGVTSGLNRFGVTWSFFLGEFLGVVLIFIGFLISEDVFARAGQSTAERRIRPRMRST